jgi:hypothetical protein
MSVDTAAKWRSNPRLCGHASHSSHVERSVLSISHTYTPSPFRIESGDNSSYTRLGAPITVIPFQASYMVPCAAARQCSRRPTLLRMCPLRMCMFSSSPKSLHGARISFAMADEAPQKARRRLHACPQSTTPYWPIHLFAPQTKGAGSEVARHVLEAGKPFIIREIVE